MKKIVIITPISWVMSGLFDGNFIYAYKFVSSYHSCDTIPMYRIGFTFFIGNFIVLIYFIIEVRETIAYSKILETITIGV